MNKTALKNFAVWARNKLIADITYKAGLMGITEDGIKPALPQSTKDTEFYDIGTKEPYLVGGEAAKQRRRLAELINGKAVTSDYKTAFHSVIEEVAYTWFNRLIAVRFMEVNDYLPSHIRVLSSESADKLEPDLVTTPFDADLELTETEKAEIIRLKNDNQVDALFRMLFIKQCNTMNAILPKLFEKTADYSELLLNVSVTDQDGVVYHLVHDISEDDFNIEKGGQVEIIGWLYQYYNTEPKDETFALLKKNVKITKERIPSATQLFTPDWIVRYMVENSLGRLWLEGHPNDSLKSGWKYYLDEAKQEPEVQAQLDKIREEYKTIKPEDIKVIDPCMGSGHILVYAFDVLMQIYETAGYSQRDAAKSILEHNLYGLDIDDRAFQLAYFAVMMKARQYNRFILNGETICHIYSIQESNGFNPDYLKLLGDDNLKATAEKLITIFTDAKEYGSILSVDIPLQELEVLRQRTDEISEAHYDNFFDSARQSGIITLLVPVLQQALVMAQKYDVVVTNPPYMGTSNGDGNLNKYIKKNYPDSKSDLFAVLIEKCGKLTKQNGYQAMITQHAWMFLSSFEKLREKLMLKTTINMAHLGARAFDEIGGEVVQTTSFVLRNSNIDNYSACYVRLVDYQSQQEKETAFLEKKDIYYVKKSRYALIPGEVIAYWISDNTVNTFKNKILYDVARPRQGMATTNNDLFLRLWYEVSSVKVGRNYKNGDLANDSGRKWFPVTKGGSYRRWYGNFDYIVNYINNGKEICNFIDNTPGVRVKSNGRVINRNLYFHHGLTWSTIASGPFAMRYVPDGFIFETKGSMCFADDSILLYLLGLYNSKVIQLFLSVVSPTLDYHEGPLGKTPVVIEKNERIDVLVKRNVEIAEADWNSFETSWDFKYHPLLQWLGSKAMWGASNEKLRQNLVVAESYAAWKALAEQRFLQLKSNEEELNRIFINIYSLQDELTPEVKDKDVTVARIYDTKEEIPESMKGNNYVLTKCDVIKSFLSYAVGCMFGRYSLNKPGLVFADGNFEKVYWKFKGQAACDENGDLPFGSNYAGISMAKYHYPKFRDSENWETATDLTFEPDVDNCIPITDEEYFEDDIVGRFVEFIKAVYREETLEENLDFIANALGNKGNTSREVIRNYFLNDFFKDHCKTYKKRPIYWLFDSGKQNGFKALIYLHRYNENTVGNLRIDYLHRMERVYESEITRMQDTIDNSVNAREVTAATKRKEKLQKQIKECKEYDEKIAHLALARIAIDLDDGVKVNYEKVQTDTDGKLYQVLAKI